MYWEQRSCPLRGGQRRSDTIMCTQKLTVLLRPREIHYKIIVQLGEDEVKIRYSTIPPSEPKDVDRMWSGRTRKLEISDRKLP